VHCGCFYRDDSVIKARHQVVIMVVVIVVVTEGTPYFFYLFFAYKSYILKNVIFMD